MISRFLFDQMDAIIWNKSFIIIQCFKIRMKKKIEFSGLGRRQTVITSKARMISIEKFCITWVVLIASVAKTTTNVHFRS